MKIPLNEEAVRAVSLAEPHQFLAWAEDAIAYLVRYQPGQDGKAKVIFELADDDFTDVWAGGSETVDIAHLESCGGYLHLVKWAETVVAIEFDYERAEKAFQRQDAAALAAA